MHPHVLLYSAIVSSLAHTAFASRLRSARLRKDNTPSRSFFGRLYDQIPIADISPPEPEATPYTFVPSKQHRPEIINIMPVLPSEPTPEPTTPPTTGVMISDVIGKTRSINIFAGFTRDIDTVSSRLGDKEQTTTILCPLNSALQALPRKPWEDPADYDNLGANAYAGQSGEDRAHENLRRFVESHVVMTSPWKEGQKVKTLGGGEIWWEQQGDKRVIMPGGIEVDSLQEKVGNGEVWIIKGVVNYAK